VRDIKESATRRRTCGIRRTFAKIQRDADRSAAALIAKVTNRTPRRRSETYSGDKFEREFIRDPEMERASERSKRENQLDQLMFSSCPLSAGSVTTTVADYADDESWPTMERTGERWGVGSTHARGF
jgi:hypothetical protein